MHFSLQFLDGESSEDDHKEILDSYDELYDEPENLADESDDDQVFGGRSNHSYSDYEENISSKFAEESQAQESTHEIEYESAAKFPEDRRAEDLAKGKAAKCQLGKLKNYRSQKSFSNNILLHILIFSHRTELCIMASGASLKLVC